MPEECSGCAFGDGPQISADGDPTKRIIVIGQSPGPEEVKTGKPFVGPSGRLLWQMLGEVGITRHDCYVDNVFRCQPPQGHEYTSSEIKLCSSLHLKPEMGYLKEKHHIILSLGNEAWHCLFPWAGISGTEAGTGDIGMYMNTIPAIRCIHPSAVLRNPDHVWIFRQAVARLRGLIDDTWWEAGQPQVLVPTTHDEMLDLVMGISGFSGLMSFDIESVGTNEYQGKLLGVAFSTLDESFYVSLFDHGLGEAPNELVNAVRELLSSGTFCAHNRNFDARWVQYHLGVSPNIPYDTLTMHTLLNENTAQSLGVVSKWLLNMPDWKHVTAGYESKMDQLDYATLAEYAAKDAYCTLAICHEMLNDDEFLPFIQGRSPQLYTDLQAPLLDVILRMEQRGLRVDQAAVESASEELGTYIETEVTDINDLTFRDGTRVGDLLPEKKMAKFEEEVQEKRAKKPDWGIKHAFDLVKDQNSNPQLVTANAPTQAVADRWVNSMAKKYVCGVNPNSNDDVAWLLFNLLELSPLRTTPSGKPSTDKDTIKALQSANDQVMAGFGEDESLYPEEAWLLQLRKSALHHLQMVSKLAKVNGTFVKGLLKWIEEDGRVHSHFRVVSTGRLGSSSPNNHNQPKSVRPLFIPADGYRFVEADFSQMELRCMAVESKDTALIEALATEDVHTAVTSWLFNIPYDDVTEEQRYKGKTLNFAILYQMGPTALGEVLEITEDEAVDLIKAYFDRFTEVAKWVDYQKRFAKQHGFVYNMVGRVRRLPGAQILGGGSLERCLRQAVNAPIQSLAADITNLSIMRATNEIPGYQEDWHLVNTVHDSVLVEVKESLAEQFETQLVEILTQQPFDRFTIPLKVDSEITDRWGGEFDINKMIPEALRTIEDNDE